MQTHLLLFFQQPVAGEQGFESQSFLDVIISSGPLGWVIMTGLLGMSFVAVYIFFERYRTIKQSVRVDESFMNNLRAHLSGNNLAAAKALCQSTDLPVARMVEKGLLRTGKPLKDIESAIENVANLELYKLEKNLSTLASISGAAPMVGFFGTVTGMIMAFYEMATAENITPSLLAGGIYQALITTAFGLLIGIFAQVGYNLLTAKVAKAVNNMEMVTLEFLDLLLGPTN